MLDGKTIIYSQILPKLTSNHHPFSLQFEKEEELGPIPFKFSPLWLERVGFMDIVTQAWSKYVVGSPNFLFEQKLKNTKLMLKKWVKSPLPSPTTNRKGSVSELFAIQIGMENCEITSSQLALKQLAQFKSSQSFRHEEEHLRLKSRSLWLMVGDKNSAYFHRQCRNRLSRNHISEIPIGDGVTIKGQDLLKQSASIHFQQLFQDDGLYEEEVSSEFLDNIPLLVSLEDNNNSMKHFFGKRNC